MRSPDGTHALITVTSVYDTAPDASHSSAHDATRTDVAPRCAACPLWRHRRLCCPPGDDAPGRDGGLSEHVMQPDVVSYNAVIMSVKEVTVKMCRQVLLAMLMGKQ